MRICEAVSVLSSRSTYVQLGCVTILLHHGHLVCSQPSSPNGPQYMKIGGGPDYGWHMIIMICGGIMRTVLNRRSFCYHIIGFRALSPPIVETKHAHYRCRWGISPQMIHHKLISIYIYYISHSVNTCAHGRMGCLNKLLSFLRVECTYLLQ